MNKKQFILNITSNIIAFVLNAGMSFFLTPYLIRVLGKEAYSFYPLSNTFVEYANIFAIAFNSVAARFVAIEIHRKNYEKANKYFNSILFSNLFIGLICVIISAVMIFKLEKIIQIPQNIETDVKWLFALIFLNFVVNLSSVAMGICTTVKNRLELTSFRKMESTIIRVVLTVALLFCFVPHIAYIGIGALVATIFVLITNCIYTKKLMPEVNISLNKCKLKYVKNVMSAGVWNSIEKAGSMMFSGANLLLTNILLGASLAGSLSIARTVPSFIISFLTTVVSVFVPMILKSYALGNKEEIKDILRLSSVIITVLINIPIAVFIALGQDFYHLWVPGENSMQIYICSIILVLPNIVNAPISCFRNIYIAANKLRVPAIVLCCMGIANVMIAVVLVKLFPSLSIYAIIVTSSLIRILYDIVFSVVYLSKILNGSLIKIYIMIARTTAIVLITLILGVAVRHFIEVNSWFDFAVVAIIVMIIGVLFSFFVVFGRSDRNRVMKMILRKLNKE